MDFAGGFRETNDRPKNDVRVSEKMAEFLFNDAEKTFGKSAETYRFLTEFR